MPWRVTRACALLLLPLAAACSDRSPTVAPPVQPVDLSAFPAAECRVDVAERTLACTDARIQSAPSPVAGSVVGGQALYARLAAAGTTYDAATAVLASGVTVQNLRFLQTMGTTDGRTVSPVRVFVAGQPTRTGGTGSVYLAGADGRAQFATAEQPYYEYAQMLAPYEVSAARPWRFHVDPTVTAFVFTVYLSAPLATARAALVSQTWTGATDTDWGTASNWDTNTVPDSASAVTIPAALLLLTSNLPLLGADGQITDLTVGLASTLGLGTHTLTAWGNVAATGTVANGTLWMRGTGASVGGSVNKLRVDGRVSLQSPVTATGTVSVTGGGSLSAQTQAIIIQIP